MSTPVKLERLPNFAILSDKVAARYARLTEDGVYDLAPKERFWQARHQYLLDHGYLLRPRYTPGWEPSWIGTNHDPTYCEDSIMLIDHQLMDATRLSDNERVAIKYFRRDSQENDIAQFFSSISDKRNHCVPIYEILPDPQDPVLALMLMPYLRPCNNPEFVTIGDLVEFVDQTVEGLVFMHKHRVAHRDIAVENIMMDAKSLYPSGYHPIRLDYTPDTLYPVTPLPRAGRSVPYYYIDFGLSTHFPEGQSTFVLGDVGREEVPELSDDTPYDAFKVDIWALGNVYATEFTQKYKNTDFLLSLVERMTQRDPQSRPTAEEVMREWEKARATIPGSLVHWRLTPHNEQPLERVVNDTVAAARAGMYRLKKLVG